MDNLNCISSIGLIADIIGAILLFMYGLPSKIQDETEIGVLMVFRERPLNNAEQIKKKNKLIRLMSNIGIMLLIIGFVLQLIGTNLNPNNTIPNKVETPSTP